MALVGELSAAICQLLGLPESSGSMQSVGGGDICQSFLWTSNGQSCFIKYRENADIELFQAELDALNEIASTKTVSTPEAMGLGEIQTGSFLVLEALNLSRKTAKSDAMLGRQLATLHAIRQPYYGWHRDNFIGLTEQPNQRNDSWPAFYSQQRIGHQCRLLSDRYHDPEWIALAADLDGVINDYFVGYQVFPSLLHGDLWGGNYAATSTGLAVIYDPASYYGDRETDLAMTELFGGLGEDFYRHYRQTLPLDSGYVRRKSLYQLYHLLNHANLFGGHYLHQSRDLLTRLARI